MVGFLFWCFMYTNNYDIPLYLAVWLLTDDYDYVNDPKYISATSLMRPIKETILKNRVSTEEKIERDLVDLIPSSLGNSIHTAVESAWLNREDPSKTSPQLIKILKQLGLKEEDTSKVRVNPSKLKDGDIPIYIEQRGYKKVLGYTVGGKFDAVLGGIVHDLKTTSAFSWVYGTRVEDYKLQGSIYKWLHPDKITEDFIRISLVFTDWSKASALSNPKYPDCRIKQMDIPLLSQAETENWVKSRIKLIDSLMKSDEEDMPECTEEEVWLSKPTYRYFSNPEKTTGRATRVFDTSEEAIQHQVKAGKGVIITSDRVANKCSKYCSAFTVCKQQAKYNHPE